MGALLLDMLFIIVTSSNKVCFFEMILGLFVRSALKNKPSIKSASRAWSSKFILRACCNIQHADLCCGLDVPQSLREDQETGLQTSAP